MSDQYEKGVLKVLRYVYNQMERCRNADFDALGITSSQASVMMFLFKNRKHEVTQQSVQAALLLSHPTITGLMKRLEAKGFITRKNSPADFRCKYVKLTKKGCDIERGLKTNMKRMQDRALVGLSQEELDNLEKSLCVIAENLRKEEDMLAAERIIQRTNKRGRKGRNRLIFSSLMQEQKRRIGAFALSIAQDLRSTYHIAVMAASVIMTEGMIAEIMDGTLSNALINAKRLFRA